MTDWSLNRGEWAEGYVFLKVLGDGRIHAGTSDMKPIEDTYLDIKNVQRRSGSDIYTFERTKIGQIACIVECYKNGEKYIGVPSDLFRDHAKALYVKISGSGTGNISSSDTQKFFESIDVKKTVKSPPMSSDEKEKYGGKTDIFLRVKNSMDNMEEDIGFSIKSHFGSPSTLLNCGKGTTYLFDIGNCSDEDMIELNKLGTVKEQLRYIKESDHLSISAISSAVITTSGKNPVSGPIFDFNLEHVDSNMAKVIPFMLLCLHGYYEEPASRNIPDVVEAISKKNPLNLRSPSNPYATMFKKLLFASFCGLTASKLWDGKGRVSGGYLDVSEDGNVLYFRALSDDQFLSYLYNSTVIDNPSKGKRHSEIRKEALQGQIVKDISRYKPDHGDYGYVFEYNDDGVTRRVLGINFQIRFRR